MIAALQGRVVGYTDYLNSIVVEKSDGRVAVIRDRIFYSLYHTLDQFQAALKEDCIEYVRFDDSLYLEERIELPQWFRKAEKEDRIYESCGIDYLVNEHGEHEEIPYGWIVMRNFKDHLRLIDPQSFGQYFDFPGSEFYED